MILHPLPACAEQIPDPERFTYPFCYEPHPLCRAAAAQLRAYLEGQEQWRDELSQGKMMGVLVVKHRGARGFLAAFSGTLGGQTRQEYFVPPVFDLMSPGCHFQQEQGVISAMNRRLIALRQESGTMRQRLRLEEMLGERDREMQAMREEARRARLQRRQLRLTLSPEELAGRQEEMVRESQYQKAELRRAAKRWEQKIREAEAPVRALLEEEKALQAERKRRSEALQGWLFDHYILLNARGERQSVSRIFGSAVPPSGTGDCCAPKLLQAAYSQGMTPLCMGEFWVGASPADEVRTDGCFYPACHSRCLPLLSHMTQGLSLEENPLSAGYRSVLQRFSIQYADSSLVVVRKPEGMLSVPGKEGLPSVEDILRDEFPTATPPLMVHRLDMDTSGLMVVALTPEAHRSLQRQFLAHEVEKVYMAILEHPLPVGQEGYISLPLRPDLDDRPRQLVDFTLGKSARTHYRVEGREGNHSRVMLQPLTGRTHQLRVHCAHPSGLGNPIVGDRLYGQAAGRLMLHAQQLSLTHPQTGERMTFRWDYI